MAVTIKDIAQATGLSTATISKYLNNIPIKEENQKRIEKAIAELHYRPNLSARALRLFCLRRFLNQGMEFNPMGQGSEVRMKSGCRAPGPRFS